MPDPSFPLYLNRISFEGVVVSLAKDGEEEARLRRYSEELGFELEEGV